MLDEPFRWTEAIATRHGYVQGKLKKGQPVLALPFKEGAFLMGFCPQPGKIYEIYDRIAIGGMGHPADIEKLRMILLDMSHLEGFNRSARDVTLTRLLQFGLAPALKQNFEEVQRAPYLVQLVLVEIDMDNTPQFFHLNYDGYWETFQKGTVICGNKKMADWLEKRIEEMPFAEYPLDRALLEACKLWQEGKEQISKEDNEESPSTLKEAFDKWVLEGAVLCHTASRKSIYRPLSSQEIKKLKAACLKL
ncbi:MAG: proteasome subunit alpha [Nitrospinota bacterium]|nr:proteasome subunit alpha [Nitrospinota bacterium]